MNELLYQKNQAVAALNRVEGFEPLEFARTIKQEDQEDQLYLDVKVPETLVPSGESFGADLQSYCLV